MSDPVSRRGFLRGTVAGTAGVATLATVGPRLAEAASQAAPPTRDIVSVACTVNGRSQAVTVGADEPVVDMVRERLGLKGTKLSCGSGTCGACTVLVDGSPQCSCLLPAVALEGRSLTTVEGIAPQGHLHPVQRAFMAKDALQCGYCTPGFVVEASAFHDAWRAAHGTQEPSRDEVAQALAGHLCRCGAYEAIYAAVQAACRGEHDRGDPLPPRVEARDKVTGAARYTVDVQVEGMLRGRILRSPHAAAVLTRLDTAAAQALDGVSAVVRFVDDGGRVRYADQEVAAVAARDEDTARRGLALLLPEWQVLPHVLDIASAQAEGAPLVWELPKDAPSSAEGATLSGKWNANVRGPASSSILGKPGRADKKIERARTEGRLQSGTFQTQVQVHGALEPHAVIAWWKDAPADLPRGELPRPTVELWVSTQAVHDLAQDVAQRWKLRQQDVRVHAEHVGGGFGAKASLSMELVAAVELSRLAQAPVRIVPDRAEELSVGGNRPSHELQVEVAATADGALDAVRSVAHGSSGVAVGAVTGMIARLLYKSDDKRLEDYDVVTNTPPSRPMRGPGGPPAIFALEQVVDQVARSRGEDSITLRRRWDGHPGRLRLYDWIESLPAWAGRAGLPREGRYRQGVGLACANWFVFIDRGARVQIEASSDGIVAASACQDMGNGSRTVVATAVSEVLGLRPTDIQVRFGDSRDVPGVMSAGSRTTASMGPAATEAATELVEELSELARDSLGWDDVIAVPGGLQHGGSTVPWAQVLAATGPVTTLGRRRRDPGGYFIPFAPSGVNIGKDLAAAVQLTHVEVDTWLGKTRVLGAWVGLAAGRIRVPTLARSQVEGGVVQGIGYALYEERHLDPVTGQLLSRNMDDYRIPGIGDVPPIEVRFDDQALDGVLDGGVGIGEVCTIPTAASIANAVFDATGWRPATLPIRPDRVLEARS